MNNNNRNQTQTNEVGILELLGYLIGFLLDAAAFGLLVVSRVYHGEQRFTGKGLLGLFRQVLVVICAFMFLRFFDGFNLGITQPEFYLSKPKGTSYLAAAFGYIFVFVLILRIVNSIKHSKTVPADFPGISLPYGRISGITAKNIEKLGEYHYSDRYDLVISIVDPLSYVAFGWIVWQYLPSERSFGLMLMIMSTSLFVRELPSAYRRFIKRKESNEEKKMAYMAKSKDAVARRNTTPDEFNNEAQII